VSGTSDTRPVRWAVILAAGRGTRLGDLARDAPKALAPLGDTTLVQRQLAQMARRGVERATIVGGHRAELLRERVGTRAAGMAVEHRTNVDFARTGSAWSLVQAGDVLRRGDAVLLTHGDVVFADAILDGVLAAGGSAVAADRGWAAVTHDEVVAWSAPGGAWLAGVRKGPPDDERGDVGEFVGVSVLDGAFAGAFVDFCERRAGADRALDYEQPLLHDFVRRGEQRCAVCYTEGVPWMNVNYAEDLEQARRLFAEGAADG